MSITLSALAAAALVIAPTASDPGEEWDYAPAESTTPALHASASASCISDAPWIDVEATLVDPEGTSASRDLSLVFARGDDSLSIPLGSVDDSGSFSTRILWPGAAVDDAGNGSDWPGWVIEDGEWSDVGDADLGWTRNGASVTVDINPEVAVAISYPPSTPTCRTEPRLAGSEGPAAASAETESDLAATGTDVVTPLVLGGAALLAGAGLLVARRRRA